MKRALAAAALAAVALPAWSQDLADAKPAKECGALPAVYDGHAFAGDGDTIHGDDRLAFRLWGMDAPELRRPDKSETVPGMRARALTADLLAAAGHKVRCEPIEWDRYCRIVATCTTAAGADLTLELLRAGLAYGFYLARHPARRAQALQYSAAEAEARKQGRGLWSDWLGKR